MGVVGGFAQVLVSWDSEVVHLMDGSRGGPALRNGPCATMTLPLMTAGPLSVRTACQAAYIARQMGN